MLLNLMPAGKLRQPSMHVVHSATEYVAIDQCQVSRATSGSHRMTAAVTCCKPSRASSLAHAGWDLESPVQVHHLP